MLLSRLTASKHVHACLPERSPYRFKGNIYQSRAEVIAAIMKVVMPITRMYVAEGIFEAAEFCSPVAADLCAPSGRLTSIVEIAS